MGAPTRSEAADSTPLFPKVNEDDKAELMRERSRLIGALAAIEEALNEKHGTHFATV
jgi:hypothetical protein